MKALSFSRGERASYGVMLGEKVHEATGDFRRRYSDLRAVLAAGALDALASGVETEGIAADAISYLPTIPNPGKIICVGVNYRPHVEEMGREVPDRPLLFVRFADSLVGHREAIVKPSVSGQFDFEGEIAVVIGRRARAVTREQAADVVAGYTGFMDGSVRDWQRHTSQFTAGKNFQASGAMGPVLVTRDELPSEADLAIETRVNGRVMQRGRLADLIFDVATLIEYCSTFTELAPGDVIATGTPGGVGAARKPPVFLADSDRVEVDITGVGVLRNRVRGE